MDLTVTEVLVLLVAFLFAIYYYGMKPYYNHYEKTGVKYIKPKFPFLGSLYPILLRTKHFYEYFNEIYWKYPDEKYIGIFDSKNPLLLIRDLDLVKQIGIKDIDYFHDHRNPVDVENDLFANILFNMKGEKWREMRAALSPAFTSSKMRNMFTFIKECAEDMTDFFLNEKEVKENGVIEVEMKDVLSRYTNDVIASAVFGYKVNSLKDRDNTFYKMGNKATNFKGVQLFKFFGFLIFPSIMKRLGIKFTRPETAEFFTDLVVKSMEEREKSGLIRQDMIHLLMLAKKGSLVQDDNNLDSKEAGFATVEESSLGKRQVKRKWTEIELVAQAFVFFLGGFDTTSTMMTFFFYEMIRNPDIQKKIQKEIDEFLIESNGNFTYNDIQKLKYLDMAVSESLRMWPPLASIDRVCYKPYSFPPPNDKSNKSYQMKKGESVWIPIHALLHNPKYFPNPNKFDPERFSDENKDSINPTTYLPFGIGPRNCIGSRFALLESKLLIFYVLSKFDVIPTKKTNIPIQLYKGTLTLMPSNGMWAGLKSRTSVN